MFLFTFVAATKLQFQSSSRKLTKNTITVAKFYEQLLDGAFLYSFCRSAYQFLKFAKKKDIQWSIFLQKIKVWIVGPQRNVGIIFNIYGWRRVKKNLFFFQIMFLIVIGFRKSGCPKNINSFPGNLNPATLYLNLRSMHVEYSNNIVKSIYILKVLTKYDISNLKFISNKQAA